MRKTLCGLFVAAVCLVSESEAQSRLSLGVGTGLPYGSPLPGVGLELAATPHLSLLGGAGVFTAGTTWSYGLKLHLRSPSHRWRPFVSALRWTEGEGLYLGAVQEIGSPGGWTATYALGFGDVNLEGRRAILLGVGYRF